MSGDQVYLRHILDAVAKIEGYIHRMSQEQFTSNAMAIDAVVRELEIIGEAAGHVSAEVQRKRPGVPWRRITGVRNTLIREYFDVDVGLVWKTCRDDLPALRQELISLLETLR